MTATTNIRRFIAASFLAALISGCGDDDHNSTGSPHPQAWVSQHGEVVVSGDIGCTKCHGTSLSGGSSGLACAECHGPDGTALAGNPDLAALVFSEVNGQPRIDHPSGFESDIVADTTIPFFNFTAHRHGYIAKRDNGGTGNIPAGFPFCSDCHGKSFTGAPLPSPPFPGRSADCLACHQNGTPHSPDLAAWGPGFHHITTSPNNTVICGECHAAGQNSPLPAPSPDPSVANRCFNGTLCHTGAIVSDPIVPHLDGHWDFHKQNPEACRICHGENFTGRGAAPACFSCHNGTIAPQCTTCHDASVLTGTSSSPKRKVKLLHK